MAAKQGDRVRLLTAVTSGITLYAAGAVGRVESVLPGGASLHVRMEETDTVVTISKSDMVTAGPAPISRFRDWIVTPATSTPARPLRGDSVIVPDDLPSFITGDQLQIVEKIVARESPGLTGMRAALPPDIELQISASPNDVYIAAARHASGAITFHLPDSAPSDSEPTSRGRVWRSGTHNSLVFKIPVSSVGPSEPVSRGLLTAAIGRIVKIVVMKVVNIVAGEAIEVLGRKLEEHLWNEAQRREGWVRLNVTAGGEAVLAAGAAGIPNVPHDGRALLLLHGTFSNTLAAFRNLLVGQSLNDLKAIYGDHIYGFEHFTFSKSPAENIEALLVSVPQGLSATFDVITHSRGGLVVRTLQAALSRPGRLSNFKLGRVILVASPNLGTPLATPGRWEDTLGWFANVIEMFPGDPFTTAAAWISGGLSWLAQSVTGNLPGLSAMDSRGEVIAGLRSNILPPGVEWYALTANYQPTDPGIALRLADLGVDAFFGTENDLVVPTAGGWELGDPVANVPPNRVGCFGKGGNLLQGQNGLVNHVRFFERPETHQFILDALQGRPLALDQIALMGGLRQNTGARSEPIPDTTKYLALAAPAGFGENVASTVDVSTPAVASSTVVSVEGEGWDRQDSLQLIVLPTPDERPRGDVAGAAPTSSPKRQGAQLLATYAGASVLAPFRLRGQEDNAGERWHQIVKGHHDINDFVEGKRESELTIEELEKLGGVMFETLFREDVRRLYDQARFRDNRRKLNVVFTSMVPWVADLPWEFAFDVSCRAFLATSDVRFVRQRFDAGPS